MTSVKKLYIFTGKGGVGKTTLSLAFCKHLQAEGHRASLVYFKSGKLGEKVKEFSEAQKLADQLGIRVLPLDLVDSAKNYVAKKLKSRKVAEWIIRTPFFKSLLNMIPGFNYLIYLGQILEWIEEDPEQIIVLDAPSSGHALTMLESPLNFNEIFKSGELFQDTQKMQSMLTDKNLTKINIITLPTQLAVSEGIELEASLQDIAHYGIQLSCNSSFSQLNLVDPPNFLQTKINIETEALSLLESKQSLIIPYIPSDSVAQLVKGLVPSMKNLV